MRPEYHKIFIYGVDKEKFLLAILNKRGIRMTPKNLIMGMLRRITIESQIDSVFACVEIRQAPK